MSDAFNEHHNHERLSPIHKAVWAVLVLSCLTFAWWNVTTSRRLADREEARLETANDGFREVVAVRDEAKRHRDELRSEVFAELGDAGPFTPEEAGSYLSREYGTGQWRLKLEFRDDRLRNAHLKTMATGKPVDLYGHPLAIVRRYVDWYAPVVWCWFAAIFVVRMLAAERGRAVRMGLIWLAATTLIGGGAALLDDRFLGGQWPLIWLAAIAPALVVAVIGDARRARRWAAEAMLAVAMFYYTALIVEPQFSTGDTWAKVRFIPGDDWLAGAGLLGLSVLALVIAASPASLASLRRLGQFSLGKLLAFVTVSSVLLALDEVGLWLGGALVVGILGFYVTRWMVAGVRWLAVGLRRMIHEQPIIVRAHIGKLRVRFSVGYAEGPPRTGRRLALRKVEERSLKATGKPEPEVFS